MRQYLREVLYLLGGERRKLPWLAAAFLASSLLDFAGIGLVGPYVALLVDPRALDGTLGSLVTWLGLPREPHAALVGLGLLLVGIFTLKAVAAIGIQGAIIRYGQNQQARLQSRLMHAYQHLPYLEYLRRNSAEYVYAIEGLAGIFAHAVQIGLRTASDAIVAAAVLALLAWQSPPALALLATLILAMVYGYDRLFRARLLAYGEETTRAATTMVRGIHEGTEGLKEVRVLGKEAYFHGMVERGARDHARYHALTQMIGAAPRHLLEVAMVAFVVGLIGLFLALGHDLAALVPTLGMFAVAALRLIPAANALSTNLVQLRYSRAGVSQLYRDVASLSAPPHPEGLAPAGPRATSPEPFKSLALRDLRFTYPEATRAALDGITLEILANQSVGLIGPSGSGKTTMVDVLLGLLEPQQGEVRYNGRPLGASLAQWRSQVAYLPQQVFLVDDTLRRNVALGIEEGEIDEVRLRHALGQARLAELVAEMPEGANTMIGERGVRLSGGQRQRVALARAFYHGREVLVMDEATSALDNETESEIIEEIRRLKGRKTLIVIAHRLTTVEHCDRIFRLVDGRIVEKTLTEAFDRTQDAQ